MNSKNGWLLLLHCKGTAPVPLVNEETNWIRRLKQCSLQDLIALLLPYLFACGTLAMVSLYVYDPTIKLLVYASLPQTYQNWFTLGICLLQELQVGLVCLGILGTTWQLQVTSFDLISGQLHVMLRCLMRRWVYMQIQ